MQTRHNLVSFSAPKIEIHSTILLFKMPFCMLLQCCKVDYYEAGDTAPGKVGAALQGCPRVNHGNYVGSEILNFRHTRAPWTHMPNKIDLTCSTRSRI